MSCSYQKGIFNTIVWPIRLGLQNTPTESLQSGKTPPTSALDMTLNNPVMLKLWGMRSTPSLPSLPGPLWFGVVASDRVLYMGQIELFDI